MKIVVIGGSGRIGASVVRILAGQGHDVIAASRRTGVDVITGAGLGEALTGADMAGANLRFGHTEFDSWLRKWVRTHPAADQLTR